MTGPVEPDPTCHRTNCPAPNHCHLHGTHHAVDSMAQHCAERVTPRLGVA